MLSDVSTTYYFYPEYDGNFLFRCRFDLSGNATTDHIYVTVTINGDVVVYQDARGLEYWQMPWFAMFAAKAGDTVAFALHPMSSMDITSIAVCPEVSA